MIWNLGLCGASVRSAAARLTMYGTIILPFSQPTRSLGRWHPNFEQTSTKYDHPLPFYVSAYLQTLAPFLFAPTKADPSRGEGFHCPSAPSPSLSLRLTAKRREKKLILHFQESCSLRPSRAREEENRELLLNVLSGKLSVWAHQPFDSRNPTSTSRRTCKHIS